MILPTLSTLAPILVLLGFAALIGVLHLFKRGSSTLWIVAALGALFAWIFVFLNYRNFDISIQIMPWNFNSQYELSPTIQFNWYSWSYALAIITLLLSSLLTSIINAGAKRWITWIMSLILGAFGLWSVLALNPVTLVLAWAAMDICVLVIVIGLITDGQAIKRAVVVFSINILAVLLLSWSTLIEYPLSSEGFSGNQEMYVSLLAIAVIGLRVGGTTILSPVIKGSDFSKSLGSLLHLVPVAAAFALFNTIQTLSFPAGVELMLVVVISMIVFFNAFSWVWKANSPRHQANWIILMVGFSLVSVIRGDLDASLAWGVALILSGGILFLVSVNYRYLFLITGIGLINISMLPYTPTWVGTQLFAPPFSWGLLILLFSHILILFGYIQNTHKSDNNKEKIDRFTWAIYLWGLLLLPIVHMLIGFLMRDSAPVGLSSWIGFLSSGAALSIFLVHHFYPKLRIWSYNGNRFMPTLQKLINISWFWKSLVSLYRGLGRLVDLITKVLEGDGGILWTLLLLVLFITLIRQFR